MSALNAPAKSLDIPNKTLPLIISLCYPIALQAATGIDTYSFTIEPQTMEQALLRYSDQSGVQILFKTEDIEGLQSQGVSGNFSRATAIEKLLSGSSLNYRFTAKNTLIVQKQITPSPKKNLLAALMGLLMGVSNTQQLSAQEKIADAQDSGKFIIEEIVVTAQKREQNLIDVPMSISALGAAELEQRNITNALDLSFAVPNLSVWEQGPGRQQITIRGIGNNAGTASLIGLYLDEASVSGGIREQIDLRAIDLERVEVLRGPQGTLYGDGSAGGTVRFITRDPQLDGLYADALWDAYFTKGGDPSQEFTGVFNLPVSDTFALRFAGTYGDIGGWIDQPAALDEDINNQELFQIRTKALWMPSDQLELTGMVLIHRNEGDSGYNAAGDDGNLLVGVDRAAPVPFTDDYELYNLTVAYDFGPLELVSSSSYLNRDREVVVTQFNEISRLEFLADSVDDVEQFSQELRLVSTGDNALQWTVGAFYRDQEITTDQVSRLIFNGALLNDAFASVESSKAWAVFADTAYAITDSLEIGAGVRYFEDDRELDIRNQSDTFDAVSPRIYASYDITDTIKTYLSVAEGYRSGGFNTLPGRPPFDPETVTSYELGVKAVLLDGALQSELSLFSSDYEDIVATGIQPGSAQAYFSNIGEGEIKGIDWAFNWRATESLTLGFNGAYTDTEITSLRAENTAQLPGDPIDFIPELSYSITGDYRFNWTENVGGFASVYYNFQDSMQFTSRRTSIMIQHSDELRFLDIRIGAEFSDWTLELYGRNIADEDGLQDPFGVLNAGSRPRPRTVGVKFSTTFD